MINNWENFSQKIIGLWQSQDKKYKELKSGGIGFIILAIVLFVFSLIVFDEIVIIAYIAKNICRYIGFISILVSINFFNFYMYIYNKNKKLRNKAKIFIIPISIFLGVTLLFAIPFTILIGIISKIVSLRAKKIDNLITIMIFCLITLALIGFFIYPNFFISHYFSILIKYILESKYIFNLYVVPVKLFLFITLFMFESNLIFKLLMLYRKKELNKKKENKMKLFEKTFEDNIDSKSFDFKIYFEDKTNKKMSMDSGLQKEIDYNMSYLENTLKRVQLAILIILFIITVFKAVPLNLLDDLNKYQGDIINVLTIYTLIMLYMDKRKEWK